MYPLITNNGVYRMPEPDVNWLDKQCGPCAGLGDMYSGPFPEGVPNPFEVAIHPYPTRYHGPVYTEPMFGLPWRERPSDFAVTVGTEGLGEAEPAPVMTDEPVIEASSVTHPPAWKFAVALGLAGLTVWAAMKVADRSNARA